MEKTKSNANTKKKTRITRTQPSLYFINVVIGYCQTNIDTWKTNMNYKSTLIPNWTKFILIVIMIKANDMLRFKVHNKESTNNSTFTSYKIPHAGVIFTFTDFESGHLKGQLRIPVNL